ADGRREPREAHAQTLQIPRRQSLRRHAAAGEREIHGDVDRRPALPLADLLQTQALGGTEVETVPIPFPFEECRRAAARVRPAAERGDERLFDAVARLTDRGQPGAKPFGDGARVAAV